MEYILNGGYPKWLLMEWSIILAELMGDKEMQEKIMKEPSPRAHQSLGRKVKNFDSDKWDANCLAIVTKGNYHKFSQDPDLKNSIIRSAGLTLVEASPVDINWGIGFTADHPDAPIRSKWRGKNMLGEAIMKARTRIISENNIENMRNGTAGDDVIIIEDDIDEKIKTNNNNNDTSNNKNNNNNNNGNKNNNNNNGNKNNNNKSNNNNGNNKNNNNNNSSNNNNNKNNNNNGNKKNNNNNNNNNKK